MFGQVGQHRGAQAQKDRLHGGFQAAVTWLGDNVLQLAPDVGGDDRRRCFMSTQTVIIACAGYRDSHQILISRHPSQDGCKEKEKLHIFVRTLAEDEEIDPFTASERHNQMLTTAIYSIKWSLMQDALKTIFSSDT